MVKKYIIFAILLAGLLLRLAGLRYGLPGRNMALTTYHPDEPLSFQAMEKWKPSKLYFHPDRTILWGGFHLFPMAASIKAAQMLGFVKFGNRDFYIHNLAEADKLYEVARLVQIVCGAFSVLVLFLIVKEIFGLAAGLMAAFLLAFSAVHIVNSFLNRPDAMMLLLALLSLLFSLKVWDRSNRMFSILAGIFLGLAAVTKFSAAPYGIFPLLIHIFSPDKENRKNLAFCLGAALIAGLAGSPYIILDYKYFLSQFMLNVRMTQNAIVPVVTGKGYISYATYFLPYGNGWPVVICGLAGVLLAVYKSFLKQFADPRARLISILAWGTIIIYLVISMPKSQQVTYTLPVVPLIMAFAAYLITELLTLPSLFARVPVILLALFVGAYTGIYSLAYLKLYTGKNVREEASEWIEKNIPKGQTIGIARSYFWTPGILRQYDPPYNVLQGGTDQSFLDDAVLGLEKVSRQARYIVLSEFEYRTYLNPKFRGLYPKQAEVLIDIMGKEFTEAARFDKEAEFAGIKFPKKNFPPFDWLLPNPTILILEKTEKK